MLLAWRMPFGRIVQSSGAASVRDLVPGRFCCCWWVCLWVFLGGAVVGGGGFVLLFCCFVLFCLFVCFLLLLLLLFLCVFFFFFLGGVVFVKSEIQSLGREEDSIPAFKTFSIPCVQFGSPLGIFMCLFNYSMVE